MGKTTEALPEDDFLIKELQKGGRPTDLMTVAELRSLREHIDKMIGLLDVEGLDLRDLYSWQDEAKKMRD